MKQTRTFLARAAKYRAVKGVCSAGLQMSVLPAARAGATFSINIIIGKFHGMMAPVTPIGS